MVEPAPLTTVLSELGDLLDPNRFAIDALTPRIALAPDNRDALAAALASTSRMGVGVVPFGGGLRQSMGYLPERYMVALSTTGLNRLVAIEPGDLTVTVEAGMTLAELQARLRSHNQFVALESPDPARETVGGILATGSSALIRYAFGTPRDQVIGITVATADGRLVKSGGRVVKNVAGYDLCKLYTGSFGTLGVIVEATFRVRPLPPVSRTWVAAVPSAEAGEAALAELMASDLPATFLQAAHASAFAALPRDLDANREAPWLLAVGMDGNATLTDWMIEEANHRSGLKNRKVLDGEASNELRAALAVACGPSQSLSVRLSGPSSEVFPVMAEAANVAGREALELSATAAAGNGVVYLHFRAQSRPISGDPASKAELIPPESALRLAKWLCDRATAMEGGMAALSCPPELRAQFPMWGVAAPADGLQRRIRRQFDPGLALNRGRLFANEAALGPVEPSGV